MKYLLIGLAVVVGIIILYVVIYNVTVDSESSKLGQTREEYIEDLDKPLQDEIIERTEQSFN